MNEVKKTKKRLSLISDLIILTIMLLIFVFLLNMYRLENSDNTLYLREEVEQSQSIPGKLTIKEENNIYSKKIKDEFGINIKYGNATSTYASKVNATVQTNEHIINNNIKIIYKALQKYPVDIFINKENVKQLLHINIYIVDKFSNDNLALASKNNLGEFKIYLSNAQNLERALHHEMYHILEYYIEDISPQTFDNWDMLNPKGFYYEEDILKLNTRKCISKRC